MPRKASVNGFCGVFQNPTLCDLMIFRELTGIFQLPLVRFDPELCVKSHIVYMLVQ